jgi:purine-nucleoside phosphorylase
MGDGSSDRASRAETDVLGLPGPPDTLAEEAAAVVRGRTAMRPVGGIILGSGLGEALHDLDEEAAFSYEGLPGFPEPTVPGHAGKLVLGRLAGVPVAAFLGRIHFYEGHPLSLCGLPVRLARHLGARTMVLTASVGGLAPDLSPGTLVVGSDHLNFLGQNPLRGWRRADGAPVFLDVSRVYDPGLADLAYAEAEALGVPVARGVYAAMQGPTYETPAEIAFLRSAGAAVVGMSVVPEALPARALGMRVLGLFSVTNAVGVHVDHVDVVRVANEMSGAVAGVLRGIASRLAGTGGPDRAENDEEG